MFPEPDTGIPIEATEEYRCCNDDEGVPLPAGFDSWILAAVDDLLDNCPDLAPISEEAYIVECGTAPPPGGVGAWIGECDSEDSIQPRVYDGAYSLDIDATLSTVTVTAPSSAWDEAAVDGSIVLAGDPHSWILGFLHTSNIAVGSTELDYVSGVLTADVELDGDDESISTTSGAWEVILYALEGEDVHNWEVSASATPQNYDGTLDLSGGSWSFDVSQTSSGWTVDLHLEGDVIAESIP